MNLKIIVSCLFLSCVWLSPLYGLITKGANETQPVLYYADGQTYDRDLGILILKGHVEFKHEGSILEADYVTYNENTDIVTASGNVRLRQPNQDINFAEYVELTGDMKKGVILQLRALLEDNSKMAALEGRKFEDREELDQAVYTPCELCDDKPPTWEISARRAVKDNDNKNIHFTDALFNLNLFNKIKVPLLYLPYATQPLERRSGFLVPMPDFKTDLGALIQLPYYIAPSKDIDITVTPVLFTQKNPLLLGQYRQAFGNGFLQTEGSITQYKQSKKDKEAEKRDHFELPHNRGHFYGEGEFNLTDIWRAEFSGGTVSDKTYFRKYGFSGFKSEPNLLSKGILEGFLTSRDYAAAKAYHFQGLLDADRQKNIAAALPLLEYSAYSGTDPWGGRFHFGGNMLNIVRAHGINMQREIGEIGWQRPWVAPLGQVFTAFGSTRGDLYQVEHAHKSALAKRKKEAAREFLEKKGGARFFPQTGLNWRWPFVNTFRRQSVVLQPTGQLIAAPRRAIGIAARRIPNEDSADFEFNDANLFSLDRFPGYDRIDTGSRAVYGGEVLTTGSLFGDVEFFLGQSYALSKPNHRDKFQGLNHHPSDYVGRFEASPWGWLTLNYRFRMNQKSFNPRVSELGGTIGPAIARLTGNYLFISKHAGTPDKKDFNQINLSLSSQVTKYWTLLGLLKQDLKKKKDGGGPLERGVGLVYRDDCFGFGFTVKRQFYKDRDLRPATVVMGTLFLKNVGDYNYSFSLDQGVFGDKTAENNEP